MTARAVESSGNQQVDDIIEGLIGIYEAVFPGRIRGYYLSGSYVAGGLTPLSDLDLFVLFKERFANPEEAATARRLNQALYTARLTPMRLDIPAQGEHNLSPHDRIQLKLASRVVYGEDARDTIALPAMDEYIRATMQLAHGNLARVLRCPDWHEMAVLTFPLDYPDPDDEFFGYAWKRIPFWYPPDTTRGIKELVMTIGRITTALIAHKARRYVPQRGDSVTLYRECIGDEWSDYVAAIYRDGKARWGYLVPDDPTERQSLRNLCSQTLGFENHFLATYHAYLLSELAHGDDPARQFALDRLREVTFPDGDAST
jgi:predicted nucleotidyltransferase